MAAVLKTADRKVRGFESCSLRQDTTIGRMRLRKVPDGAARGGFGKAERSCIIVDHAERWLSGRKRSPAKRLYAP